MLIDFFLQHYFLKRTGSIELFPVLWLKMDSFPLLLSTQFLLHTRSTDLSNKHIHPLKLLDLNDCTTTCRRDHRH